jgi:NADPH-dependent glutamate synthase beta subunit-like oxidoreductase
MVILAAGFLPEIPQQLADELQVKTDSKNRLIVPGKFTTTNPRVFVAGDLATGSAYVANAIDSGRKAAHAISVALRLKKSR